MLRSIVRSALLAFLFAGAASAAVQVVDCVDGPFFDIEPAVVAAGSGDTVLVEPCAAGPFPPFEVDGKSDLHIIGNGGAGVVPAGLPDRRFRPEVTVEEDPDQLEFACVNILNSDRIVLSGFTFERCFFHAVNIGASEDVRVTGNRFGRSFETVRDSTANGSDIVGNLFVGGTFAIFVDGNGAYVAQNLIFGNGGSAVAILSPSATGNQVISNVVVDSVGPAVSNAATGTRIERNVARGITGADALVLTNNSRDTIVAGNLIEGNIRDDGENNIFVGNR